MKTIKLAITGFFLLASFILTELIFMRGFAHTGLEFAVDNSAENTLMILIVSTVLSAVGIFFLGLLSMFTYFVFIKLIYADEIKHGALQYLRYKRNKQNAKKDMIKNSTQIIKS